MSSKIQEQPLIYSWSSHEFFTCVPKSIGPWIQYQSNFCCIWPASFDLLPDDFGSLLALGKWLRCICVTGYDEYSPLCCWEKDLLHQIFSFQRTYMLLGYLLGHCWRWHIFSTDGRLETGRTAGHVSALRDPFWPEILQRQPRSAGLILSSLPFRSSFPPGLTQTLHVQLVGRCCCCVCCWCFLLLPLLLLSLFCFLFSCCWCCWSCSCCYDCSSLLLLLFLFMSWMMVVLLLVVVWLLVVVLLLS